MNPKALVNCRRTGRFSNWTRFYRLKWQEGWNGWMISGHWYSNSHVHFCWIYFVSPFSCCLSRDHHNWKWTGYCWRNLPQLYNPSWIVFQSHQLMKQHSPMQPAVAFHAREASVWIWPELLLHVFVLKLQQCWKISCSKKVTLFTHHVSIEMWLCFVFLIHKMPPTVLHM